MQIKVNPDLCIGCGSCTQICPEVFEMVGDKSVVKKDVPLNDPTVQEKARMAAEACPAGAVEITD